MRKLRILYTGGTIGGKQDSESGVIEEDIKRKQFMELLFKKYPLLEADLEQEKVEISSDTPIKEFSENIIPSDWKLIVKSIHKAIDDGVESIVVAHGTDTMCYTSAALSFMLQGIEIPIVMTGSNFPLEVERTDAPTNMHDAIRVALDNRFKGIFLVFSGIENQSSDIHLGCRARKEKFYDNCFKSVNVEMIGKLQKRFLSKKDLIKIVNHQLLSQIIKLNEKKSNQLKNQEDRIKKINIEDKISFFKVYPGFNPELIDYVIEKGDTKGIILELYNSGTGCIRSRYSLLKSLDTAKSKEIPVFITSQHEGSVLMDTYISSRKLKEVGAIPLKDMITEAAIPKLMWVLGQTSSIKEVTEMMLTNLCGEIEAR
ncbi:MAG TPA: asparaginase domain-containing protein [Candidatus Methanoperedens sp.]